MIPSWYPPMVVPAGVAPMPIVKSNVPPTGAAAGASAVMPGPGLPGVGAADASLANTPTPMTSTAMAATIADHRECMILKEI